MTIENSLYGTLHFSLMLQPLMQPTRRAMRLDKMRNFLRLASAATATITPITQISSKVVEKDGLFVQISLKKPEISTDEQPQFAVRFTNGLEEYINLCGMDEYWSWKVRFTNLDQKAEDPGPWLLNVHAERIRHLVSSNKLKPGDFVEVPGQSCSPARARLQRWQRWKTKCGMGNTAI